MKKAGPTLLILAVAWSGSAGAAVRGVVTPKVAFEADHTVVWCPVFQAAWDEANRQIGSEVENSGSPLAGQLDQFEWEADRVLPEDRWRVWAGRATPALHQAADAGARRILGIDAPAFPELEGAEDQEGRPVAIAAYAALHANLRYVRPLYRSKSAPMNFIDALDRAGPVHFFGVRGQAAGGFKAIRVLHHAATSHALEIPAKQSEHLGNLLLYLPEEKETFAAACKKLREWRAGWWTLPADRNGANDPSFHQQDSLRVPYVRFQARSDFADELKGYRTYRGKPLPYTIIGAWQKVDFLLHEEGAEVRAVAGVGFEPFGPPPPPPKAVPRDFSYDRPFFVMLWREDAGWPYFAAWVGGREAMKPWR